MAEGDLVAVLHVDVRLGARGLRDDRLHLRPLLPDRAARGDVVRVAVRVDHLNSSHQRPGVDFVLKKSGKTETIKTNYFLRISLSLYIYIYMYIYIYICIHVYNMYVCVYIYIYIYIYIYVVRHVIPPEI